ncbi:ATP-dependent DNA helicase [Schizosaccharomyces japonicus yFS275]|uniref:ATP-dependent DNA helicase n=1 Tax=Schizosaccharomyces japonicus (strain yFS275 / FY16936) TaxID=402676 RepID=B6JXH2_SCHJY|nr:ATP-dependent DNA helicase [Schizosaccharomyces japonicus yFS275]EEB05116.2 ATP-dependent DNA helicase [Schizosaccharomyces japonicus yFS275]
MAILRKRQKKSKATFTVEDLYSKSACRLLCKEHENTYEAFLEQYEFFDFQWNPLFESVTETVPAILKIKRYDGELLLQFYPYTEKKITPRTNLPVICEVNMSRSDIKLKFPVLELWSRLWDSYRSLRNYLCFHCTIQRRDQCVNCSIGVFIQFTSLEDINAVYVSGASSPLTNLFDFVFPLKENDRNLVTCSLFYESSRNLAATLEADNLAKNDKIHATFLPFQKRAITWMVKRERLDRDCNGLPPMWESIRLDAESKDMLLYINRVYGYITPSRNTMIQLFDESIIRGGILADEMGMGKTLEVIGLIASNPCSEEIAKTTVYDPVVCAGVPTCHSTLIFTPSTLLEQWLSELKKFAPSLRVLHYKGVKKLKENFKLSDFHNYDVVLANYSDLHSELLYAQSNERLFRNAKKYVPPKSPLIQFCWWRICLDEAQMVEMTQAQVAQMLYRIPRHNAWAISGTPVRHHVEDLFGLLYFLRYKPVYLAKKQTWNQLITLHRSKQFCELFFPITCRHTKNAFGNELHLPSQKQYLVKTQFSPIEETNYRDLLKESMMLLAIDDSTDLSSWMSTFGNNKLDILRRWVTRLRQTCCHPQVGSGNKSAFMDEGMKTIQDVLKLMVNNTISSIYLKEFQYFSSVTRSAWIYDHIYNFTKAIEMWKDVLKLVDAHLHNGFSNILSPSFIEIGASNPIISECINSFLEKHSRSWKLLKHRLLFFIASSYNSLEDTKKEDEYYALAKETRIDLMRDASEKVNQSVTHLIERSQSSLFSNLPRFSMRQCNDIFNQPKTNLDARQLTNTLNVQADAIEELRDRVLHILQLPLFDQDSTPSGDEYEESLLAQSLADYGLDVLHCMILDRQFALNGATSFSPDLITATAEQRLNEELAKYEGEAGEDEEKRNKGLVHDQNVRDLLDTRNACKPTSQVNGTLLALIDRETSSADDSRFYNAQLARNTLLKEHTDSVNGLEKQLGLLRSVYNVRVVYYKQLQEISDTLLVSEPSLFLSKDKYHALQNQSSIERSECCLQTMLNFHEERLKRMIRDEKTSATEQTLSEKTRHHPNSDPIHERNFYGYVYELDKSNEKEQQMKTELLKLGSRQRYLNSLIKQLDDSESSQECVICRDTIIRGCITVCGHKYCVSCLSAWLAHHKSCPICKQHLGRYDVYIINNQAASASLAQQEGSLQNEKIGYYYPFDKNAMDSMKKIKLKQSFSSKIDTIVRHLLHIRSQDVFAKVVVFSQWADVLDGLHLSFRANDISFVKFDGRKRGKSIQDFVKNPTKQVLTLHAHSQSSGLTLIAATHVILCEPLLNPSLELQAISRVHRIGQTKPTSVYVYVTDNSIEEEILRLSIQKRQQVVTATDEALAANTVITGENATGDELFRCFQMSIMRQTMV